MTSNELFNHNFKKGTKVVIGEDEKEVIGMDFQREILMIVVETTEDGTKLIGEVNASSVSKVVE